MKKRIIIKHLVIIIAVTLYMIVVDGCLFRKLIGIPCPFCGLSRAYYSMLTLDFRQAFIYHPLFLFIPPFLLFAFHYRILKIRPLTANIIIISGSILIILTYIFRMVNGIII